MQHLHFVSLASRARVVLFVVVAAACGDSPTAPSRYPQVAGSYIGDVRITRHSPRFLSVAGPYQIEVTQAGNRVTVGRVSASVFGEGFETPFITGTINAEGVVTLPAGAFLGNEPPCGTWMLASATISFSGRSMRIEVTMETDHCGEIGLSGTLSLRG